MPGSDEKTTDALVAQTLPLLQVTGATPEQVEAFRAFGERSAQLGRAAYAVFRKDDERMRLEASGAAGFLAAIGLTVPLLSDKLPGFSG